MLCTKWSTALISLVTAAALFVLIPGVLDFLSYAKALEEEVLVEPEPSASPEVKAYLNSLSRKKTEISNVEKQEQVSRGRRRREEAVEQCRQRLT
ncbi:unnamed protein product [Sphagnum troendelagicum]|uniref:Uncharacterized protein n=1 Tax=Sphagnum troendelagicum TaxID=128251 RepID=A0ABP0T767_9BRYO